MPLFLAVRAGDGIRTRECLLGNRATLRSAAPLAFPWISAMTPSVIRRIKRLNSARVASRALAGPMLSVSRRLLIDHCLWLSPFPAGSLENWK